MACHTTLVIMMLLIILYSYVLRTERATVLVRAVKTFPTLRQREA